VDSGAAQGNNSIKMQRAMRIITTPTTPVELYSTMTLPGGSDYNAGI
jgi:hypothetical protein|tara:strand:- start:389 stop:529 length:141 start_codon:yes stop_codon:yes gene_type:complete